MLSPCVAQSKQEQNEEHYKWGQGKTEFLVLNKFSVIEREKKH